MKATQARGLLFVAGLLLIVWAMLPYQSLSVGAAPLLIVTETPSVEPATRTPTPTLEQQPAPSATPTSVGPTATATPTAPAPPPPDVTSTPTPTSPAPPPPDNTAEPPRDDTSRPSATPTVLPSATPTTGPAVLPLPDPAITKSVNPPVADVGDTVVYTIQVTNVGSALATGVTVEDTLPAFLALSGATASRGTVTTDGNRVRVEIGDLPPTETVTITVTAQVVAAPIAPNNRNLAVVQSSSPDSNPDNNQASVPIDSPPPASLPNTGAGSVPFAQTLATIAGFALIVASLLLRRRARW